MGLVSLGFLPVDGKNATRELLLLEIIRFPASDKNSKESFPALNAAVRSAPFA